MTTMSAWLMAKVAACDATPSKIHYHELGAPPGGLDGFYERFLPRFLNDGEVQQGLWLIRGPLRQDPDACAQSPFHLRPVAVGVDAGDTGAPPRQAGHEKIGCCGFSDAALGRRNDDGWHKFPPF
jgi:hypothetical protein